MKHDCLLILLWTFYASLNGQTIEDSLKDLHSKFAKYNNAVRPNKENGRVPIYVDLELVSFQGVSADGITVEIILTQSWNDSRLSFKPTNDNAADEAISLGLEKLNEIWKPDTYFLNSKSTTAGGDKTSFKIFSSGVVELTQKLGITAKCSMYYADFPLDIQSCGLTFGSFSQTYSDLEYLWKEDVEAGTLEAVEDISLYMTMPQGYYFYKRTYLEAPTPDSSQLYFELQFARSSSDSLKTFFIPSFVLAFVALLSLLLPAGLLLPRLLISLSSLLSIAFLVIRLSDQLPELSYWTIGDIYGYASCALVLVTLFLSVCSNLGRRTTPSYSMAPTEEDSKWQCRGCQTVQIISFCLLLFVLLLFNAVFAGIYGGGYTRK